jgi:mannosyltransferase
MSRTKLSKAISRIQALSEPAYLAGVLALAAVVRFINITKASIWHDEGYTMMLVAHGPAEIVARTARDVHPPLYYLALHFWDMVFGHSELAARSFSAVLMLGAIVIGYYLAKELFGHSVGRLSALFLSLGPFLVRYSQEARMYGMAACLALLATWLLVRAQRQNRTVDWIGYGLTIAAALYTHYYAVFIVVLHWFYMAITSQPRRGILRLEWWGANALAAALFLPWLPSAYHQFTRVQAAFWIPKPTVLTLPATLAQFLTFTDLGVMTAVLRLGAAGLLGALVLAFCLNRKYFSGNLLISGLTFLGPVLVLLLSLKRPIYVDRYFVFAAAGFYILLAALLLLLPLFRKPNWLRPALATLIILTFAIGIRNVYAQATHDMRGVAGYVNRHYKAGDIVISGELYTYFDFSYYNQTGQTAKLLSPDGLSGYGESSLLYDRADQIVAAGYGEVHPTTGRAWLIGKPGEHDYYNVPPNWQFVDRYESADSEARLYQIQ